MNRWWIFLIAALAGALITKALPASAVTRDGNTFIFSDAEIAQCQAGGGCVQMTMQALHDALQRAHDVALRNECRSHL